MGENRNRAASQPQLRAAAKQTTMLKSRLSECGIILASAWLGLVGYQCLAGALTSSVEIITGQPVKCLQIFQAFKAVSSRARPVLSVRLIKA
jgi:hypothetical protein